MTEFEIGTLYFSRILDDRFHLSFRADKDSTGKHTHFFLQKKCGDEHIDDQGIQVDDAFKIYYIFREQEEPPLEGLTDVCLQIGFSYIDKKDWHDIFIEFLVGRQLNQELINNMCAWVEYSLEDMDEITLVDESGEVLFPNSIRSEA